MQTSTVQGMGHREFLAYEYALINPLQLEPDQWRDLQATPLRPRAFTAEPGHLPQLVALSGLSQDMRLALLMRSERWMQRRRVPFFSALLRSNQPHETLLAHFSTRMAVMTPQRTNVWLRFHDPRVFSRLDSLLNDAQLHQLLGPVDAWTWFDALAGQWRTRDKPTLPDPQLPTGLNPQQLAALYRQPLLNRCLKQLAREGHMPPDYHPIAERLDQSLHQALALGLTDRDDACLYALSIEHHGPQWPAQSGIREAIQLAQRGEQSLLRSVVDMEAAAVPQTAVQWNSSTDEVHQ